MLIGGEVFDDHRHSRVFRIGEAGVEFQIERALTAGTFFKLECIFLFKSDILEVAAADGAFQLLEAFTKEFRIEEVPLWRGCR